MSSINRNSNPLHGGKHSQFEFVDKEELIARLFRIKDNDEHSDAGWDGDTAKPINNKAYSELREIIHSLPDTFHAPEIIPEPDGTLNLEWFKHKNNVTSLGVDGSGKIYYKIGLYTEIDQNSFPTIIDDIKLRLTFN